MEVGQQFVPRGLFVGTFTPRGLNAYKGISGNAKRVWAQLAFYAGDQGFAWPTNKQVADDLAVSVRCVIACLNELEADGFTTKLGTRHRRTLWGFLWHPCFEGSMRKVHSSNRGSMQELHTTPVDEVEPAKYAESAQDSMQNLHMIVGNNCILPRSPLRSTEEKNRREVINQPSLTSGEKEETPNRGDPVVKEIWELFAALYMPGMPPDIDYQELQAHIDDTDAQVVLDALGQAQKYHKRGRAILAYIRPILARARKEAENGADSTEGNNWR